MDLNARLRKRSPMALDQQSKEHYQFNSTIEIKTSRSENPVPVIEGIHLHSIYNPAKEAESFIQKYEQQLKNQNRILVLGLGFGYHVWQLEAQLRRDHNHWQILIVEPDLRIVDEFENYKPVELSSCTRIVTHSLIENYYDDIELVRFMATKPLVVAHPATFNLHERFFKAFMSFEASNSIESVCRKIADQQLSRHIESLGQADDDFDSAVKNKLLSGNLNSQDFFLGIYSEMSAGATK